jgi:hypothetical protein
MRVYVALAALALVLLAGCTTPGSVDATPTGQPSLGGPPASPTPASPVTATPAPGTTPGPPATPDRGGGPADDELPGPLPLPGRTLSGTVQRLGACTVLLTGQRRWGLTGPLANRLATGDRVRVDGRPVPVPADCRRVEVFQAVLVSRTQPA